MLARYLHCFVLILRLLRAIAWAALLASYAMTPEARALANNFASNKGALPWPVERGLITGKFGKHPHPVVKGVVVDNPHIEISTEQGAVVRQVLRAR